MVLTRPDQPVSGSSVCNWDGTVGMTVNSLEANARCELLTH